jgi:hypothetical protein
MRPYNPHRKDPVRICPGCKDHDCAVVVGIVHTLAHRGVHSCSCIPEAERVVDRECSHRGRAARHQGHILAMRDREGSERKSVLQADRAGCALVVCSLMEESEADRAAQELDSGNFFHGRFVRRSASVGSCRNVVRADCLPRQDLTSEKCMEKRLWNRWKADTKALMVQIVDPDGCRFQGLPEFQKLVYKFMKTR